MKPLALFYAGLVFCIIMVCGAGWYEGMMSGNAPTQERSINTTNLSYTEIFEDTDALAVNVSGEMQEDFKSSLANIPGIGGVLVQVFSVFQVTKSFFLALWDGLTIGTLLLTDLVELLPPQARPPPQVVRIAYIGMVMMVVGSIVYLLLGRRT